MTDVTYDNLSQLTGKLKRAAIDAYMKDDGWEVEEDRYKGDTSSIGTFKVSRPGSDGQGGGNWTGPGTAGWFGVNDDKDDAYHGAFDDIRASIDELLEPWQDLPTPSGFDDSIEHLRKANGALSLSSSTSGGQATGAGTIGGSLSQIDENQDQMAGGTISAFKDRFLLQLRKAIGGHHGLTVILGGALSSEMALWEQARLHVAETVSVATGALHAHAHDNSSDWALEFKLAAAVIGGVTAFASGGASVVLTGAGTGLQILTALDEEAQKASAPASQDFDGLIEAFGVALDELDQEITNEEQRLHDNLVTNLERVLDDKSSYDLTNPIQNIDDDSGLNLPGNPAVFYSRPLVREITDYAMPGIARELLRARTQTYRSIDSSPFYRDPAIGLSEKGCFTSWSELAWCLRDVIGELRWEVANGAITLRLAIEDIDQVDTDAKDALERHAERVLVGSGYTPWD